MAVRPGDFSEKAPPQSGHEGGGSDVDGAVSESDELSCPPSSELSADELAASSEEPIADARRRGATAPGGAAQAYVARRALSRHCKGTVGSLFTELILPYGKPVKIGTGWSPGVA